MKFSVSQPSIVRSARKPSFLKLSFVPFSLCLPLAALLSQVPGYGQTLPGYKISTVVGSVPTTDSTTGAVTINSGFAGDAGAATAAKLNAPLGLALSGNTLYIADELNHVVRTVSVGSGGTGTINTFAGSNTLGAGLSGDGAAATKAQLHSPTNIAAGTAGVYLADSGNALIRLVAPNGNISSVAGNKVAGYSGDAALATGAQLNFPYAVAIASDGSYFIADTNNNRIRKVGTDLNINTVIGTGAPEYTGDGGLGTAAQINRPQGLAFDSKGNLYFADTDNHVIRKYTLPVAPATIGTISTVAGTGTGGFSGDGGPATKAKLNYPQAIAFDGSGNLYIADTFNQRIRVVATDGTIHTIAGLGLPGYSGDGDVALAARMNFPRGIAVDASGNVYVSDTTNAIVRLLTPTPITTGSGPAINPNGIISASDFGGAAPSLGNASAPGSWVEIYGTNLASKARSWVYTDLLASNFPTQLDDVSVTVGGQPAYLTYVSPGQIDALLPSTVPTGKQDVVVTTANGSSTALKLTVNPVQPLLAAPPGWNSLRGQYMAAFFADGTFVLPAITAGRRPAKAGDVIILYGIGFGALAPAQSPTGPASPQAGQAFTFLGQLQGTFQISIGGVPATVLYAGLSPYVSGPTMYDVGLYQFNVVVPKGIAANDFVPVTFTLNGVAGSQALGTAIGN